MTLAYRGMIAAPHALASEAGVEVLKAGGSAVDTAIAANAVLNVVYPHTSGIGDAFWLIYDGASGEVRLLNAAGRVASGATIWNDLQCRWSTWHQAAHERLLRRHAHEDIEALRRGLTKSEAAPSGCAALRSSATPSWLSLLFPIFTHVRRR